jgi:tetratricopeptide (TPR) repeat protein
MGQSAEKYKIWFIYLVLAAITFAVYWQVHNFEFTNYDDDKYVYDNVHISSGLTPSNIAWVFTHAHVGNWHPLTGLSHILDCQLFDLKAGRHHMVNLLFHIANTLLLLTVLRRMTGKIWQSAFVAALFAIHPLHVESVAWISERKDVLSTLFWILTIWAYFRYTEKHSTGWYTLAIVLFAFGLMAKPMPVTLPFVLLLLDYWPLNRFELKSGEHLRRCIQEKIPFFILSTVSSVITFTVQKNSGVVSEIEVLPLATRAANAVISYGKYIEKMFWPANLAAFYPYPDNQLQTWRVFAAAVLLIVITICVVRLATRHRYLPVGWFWFLGTLVPVIGIVQVGSQAMADRYTYVPLIGLFIIAAWGLPELFKSWRYRKIALASAALAILSALAICAWVQTSHWKNTISLFEHALKVTDRNYTAYIQLGNAYYAAGETEQAISAYGKAIEKNAGDSWAYYNRGNVYAGEDQYDRAIIDYSQAIERNPSDADFYQARGTAYYGKGETDMALADYNKAIELDGEDAETYYDRGTVYLQAEKQFDLAIADYSKAIEINPKFADIYCNRGVAYYSKGEIDLAISDYNKAIEINPEYADAYNNRGNAYSLKKQFDIAIFDYDTAIELNPELVESYWGKASTCEHAGRKAEAIEAYKDFIQHAPHRYANHIEGAKQKVRELEQQ